MSAQDRTTEEPSVPSREGLLEAAMAGGRELSSAILVFHTSAARDQRLSESEERALDLLERAGPMTPKDLAEACQLSPPTITALVDRLVARRRVRRIPHPVDGRRVLVEIDPAWLSRLDPAYADLAGSLRELCAEHSDQQLAMVTDFLLRAARLHRESSERLSRPR